MGAHGELLQWEAFTDAVNRIEDADTKQVLTWLRDLFGLTLIEKHLSWYLINGRLSNQRAAAVTRYIDRLLENRKKKKKKKKKQKKKRIEKKNRKNNNLKKK